MRFGTSEMKPFEWLNRAYAQREDSIPENESGPAAEELAQRLAICRVLEEAQAASLKYVALFRINLWETEQPGGGGPFFTPISAYPQLR